MNLKKLKIQEVINYWLTAKHNDSDHSIDCDRVAVKMDILYPVHSVQTNYDFLSELSEWEISNCYEEKWCTNTRFWFTIHKIDCEKSPRRKYLFSNSSHDISLDDVLDNQPAALILSGGPSSVFEKNALKIDSKYWSLKSYFRNMLRLATFGA